jgi:ELWxxDGT repeat protein
LILTKSAKLTRDEGGAPTFQNGLKPANLTVFNGEVYFNASDGFWVTDGTAAGTHELTNAVHAPSELAILVGGGCSWTYRIVTRLAQSLGLPELTSRKVN